jgi:radical SAM superfamily enzyme YgiQ (UPF0313 family)
MQALLISTYELGRQPFGLASPAAWLRARGWAVACADLAKERLRDDLADDADLIAFHLQMHTATRLAGPVIARLRARRPDARFCAYGLYAPLNADWLHALGVDDVFAGEFEGDLAALADRLAGSAGPDAATAGPRVPRLRLLVPDRTGLPPLQRYATLVMPDGSRKVVGSTEASRGCRHLCRHCPVVPVYEGQFRIVPPDVVLEDVANQVAAGARHVTFGDPDFFNGPTHAMRIVDGMHARFPGVTYDVTVKIEHLRQHRDLLPRLRDTGCLFITSAVESVDDVVLARLEKGHTRADFVETVRVCRDAGVTLVPTFVAFHPWLTLGGYADLLDTIAALDLVERVAPIQLAIRLLVPQGSRMLDLPELRPHLRGFDPATLAYRWTHPDPRVDALHGEVSGIVGANAAGNRRELFGTIHALACARAGRQNPPPPPAAAEGAVPYVDEPWYCCAEPNPDALRVI